LNKEKLVLKEAYKLRYEYYNFYENKETKWHDKYKNHKLYNAVVESLEYKFHEIANIMPELIKKLNLN